MMLARMIGIVGPIDIEMLTMGLETHKYFTDDYDLYYTNEVKIMYFFLSIEYIVEIPGYSSVCILQLTVFHILANLKTLHERSTFTQPDYNVYNEIICLTLCSSALYTFK